MWQWPTDRLRRRLRRRTRHRKRKPIPSSELSLALLLSCSSAVFASVAFGGRRRGQRVLSKITRHRIMTTMMITSTIQLALPWLIIQVRLAHRLLLLAVLHRQVLPRLRRSSRRSARTSVDRTRTPSPFLGLVHVAQSHHHRTVAGAMAPAPALALAAVAALAT